MMALFSHPLVMVALVVATVGALYGLAELWFWWSFRRDARALAFRHELTRTRWARPTVAGGGVHFSAVRADGSTADFGLKVPAPLDTPPATRDEAAR